MSARNRNHASKQSTQANADDSPVQLPPELPPAIEKVDRAAIEVKPLHQARILVAIEDEMTRRYPRLTATRTPAEVFGSPGWVGYQWGEPAHARLTIYFAGSKTDAGQMLRRSHMRIAAAWPAAVPELGDEAYSYGQVDGRGMLLLCYANVYLNVQTSRDIDHREVAQVAIDAINKVAGVQ